MKPKTLVHVFLRGGADGLNLVVPHGDPDYAALRPTLAIFPPVSGDPEDGSAGRALDLDGFFGLHPSLAPLLPLYRGGRLSVVHAVGSDDASRSHFEAQDQMEHGESYGRSLGSGWIGRWLRSRGSRGNLTAVALGRFVPESLRGAPNVAAMTRLEELTLEAGEAQLGPLTSALEKLYGGTDALARAGLDTLGMLHRVQSLRGGEELSGRDGPGLGYPEGRLGEGLGDVARLVRADLGLEVACLDLEGWDTHFFQGTTFGPLASRAEELARSLAAFDRDLGPRRDDVVVVVQTEFGRRAYENSSLGTDHGRGGVLFVLGSGLGGGRVHGRWPGLGEASLEGPGDLAVTTDHRSVLAEVLESLGPGDLGEVFPGFRPEPVGLIG